MKRNRRLEEVRGEMIASFLWGYSMAGSSAGVGPESVDRNAENQ